jgi:Trm5-related predicted tRNA methylase
MTKSLELMDKLDAPASPVVNGPEDDVLDWLSVDWQTVEDDVRRLRQRIFTASRNGDLVKVRNLQKLMLRSQANALMSVRRVTELNTGRKTAGIDQQVVVTARQSRLGQPSATPCRLLDTQARQAGVHPEVQRETAPARDTRDL